MAAGPPGPGPEHRFLERKIGTWEIEAEYFLGADAEPMLARGIDRVRALGPYWVLAESEFELPGMRIIGQAATGYDPVSRRYRSTWIDSVTPFLYSFDGSYDPERGVLELTGVNRDPQSHRDVRYRSEEIFGTEDDRVFELRVESSPESGNPGLEIPILRYQYTRRR